MAARDYGGVDLDNILLELGQFGKYQKINYCFILLPILFSGIYNSQYVFNAASVPYRCMVPECEALPVKWEPGSWGSWSLLEEASDVTCRRLRPIQNGTCDPDNFHRNDTQDCEGWVYSSNDSIVATFGLGCQEWKRTLVGTLHNAGMLTNLAITGYVSDTLGRRTAFVLSAVLASVVGFLRSFSTSYMMYVTLEFLEPLLGSGVYSTGFILALEMVGVSRRVLGGNTVSCVYALGQVLLASVAWLIPYWRTLTKVLYAPSIIFVFYFFLIEESVRWLLSKGKKEEAARIIFKAGVINNKRISPKYILQLTEGNNGDLKKECERRDNEEQSKGSILFQVLRSRIIMTRLCICSFWWITVTFIYFGLTINSVSLAGNAHVNYILISLVEIPGYCCSVLTLNRFGRKTSIMAAFFFCGFSLVMFPFVPKSLQPLATILTMLGKLCISMAFSSIYIYTSELFPTTARHRLLAFCSMVGRIGSIIAPQTPFLMSYMVSLPYILFGIMAGCAGLLMTLTPETLHIKLPDTIQQAEDIKTDHKHQISNVID